MIEEKKLPTSPASASPPWSSTTKLVVALSFVAVLAALLVSFRNLLGPLLLAVIIAFLLQPLAARVTRKIRLPWGLTVTFIYLLIVIVLVGLLTWGGITLVDQVQSLVNFLQHALKDLPGFIDSLTSKPLVLGPFSFDLSTLDISTIGNDLLGVAQSVLSRAGSLVGALASGAASTVGWGAFLLLVSYFILVESKGNSRNLINLQIPGYSFDLRRMGYELGLIWNAFLRGQFIIIGITILAYTVLLGGLGVHYYFGLAIVAGLARFVPYVGPAIAWATYFLVAYFQNSTIFGLTPFWYAALIVGTAWVTDMMMDNFVSPRLMASALQVHPAAVMVAALIAANWLGVIGIVLAAPVLATIKLFGDYAIHKMFNQDPWEGVSGAAPRRAAPPSPRMQKFLAGLEKLAGFLPVRLRPAASVSTSAANAVSTAPLRHAEVASPEMEVDEHAPVSLEPLFIRAALPLDTAEVLELSRQFFDGQDYILDVWQDWMADPNGRMVVARRGERLAGFARAVRMDAGQWWLEGLRVRPSLQRQGVATRLFDYLLEIIQREGGGTVRLLTRPERVAVQRLCEKRGFRFLSELLPFEGASILDEAAPFQPFPPQELPELLARLQSNPLLPAELRLLNTGWCWVAPAAALLEAPLRAGHVLRWRGGAGLLAFTEDRWPDGHVRALAAALVCQPDQLTTLLMDFRRLAGQRGYSGAYLELPGGEPLAELRSSAGAAGFQLCESEGPTWLFVKD